MAVMPGAGKGGSRLRYHHAGDQQRREQRDRQPHEPVGSHDAPNAKGNFCFEVTLGYRRVERGR
jgi:hypothetical protein